jgi:hypothetical protein
MNAGDEPAFCVRGETNADAATLGGASSSFDSSASRSARDEGAFLATD